MQQMQQIGGNSENGYSEYNNSYESTSGYDSGSESNSDFDQLGHLRPHIANKDLMDHQKALIFLNDEFSHKISTGFPLRAILVPEITGHPETTIEPSSPVAALKALAPSTLLQLPGSGEETMGFLSALVRRVPCYKLKAGTRLEDIPARVHALLEEICE